ncbi:MAG: hypothetical protein WC712_06970 [Candidatus Brocadiia bacterium]
MGNSWFPATILFVLLMVFGSIYIWTEASFGAEVGRSSELPADISDLYLRWLMVFCALALVGAILVLAFWKPLAGYSWF